MSQFRDLMMSIDPTDEDDSGDEQRSTGAATPIRKSPAHDGDGGDADHPVMVDGVAAADGAVGEAVDGMVSVCGDGVVPVCVCVCVKGRVSV